MDYLIFSSLLIPLRKMHKDDGATTFFKCPVYRCDRMSNDFITALITLFLGRVYENGKLLYKSAPNLSDCTGIAAAMPLG